MKSTLCTITLLLANLLAPPSARAAAANEDTRFGWFNATKAGMFITWGPYAVTGCKWKGRHGSRDAHMQNEFRIPMSEYGQLAKDFNPVKFDADAWVLLAKDAGLGYIVYVSKHHDGFAMFDSPSDPYNMVAATPFKRDPLKELAVACKKHGVVLCVYYSLGRDWAVPGVPRGGNRSNDWDFPTPPADAQKSYIQNKVKPQLRELLTQYGPIGAVWFDTPDQITKEHSAEIRDYIHSLQPACLINARIGNGLGDFDIHEQKIPAAAIHRPWEACLTINRRWGYDRNDNQWKSPEMLVRCLVDVASKGGNFLINIGPTGEGVVPEPSVGRLHALGDWMRVNGEAIRGTTAATIPVDGGGGMVFSEINPDGSEKTLDAAGAAITHEVGLPRGWRATAKPGCIYIHLFDRPENSTVNFKGLTGTVKRVTLLADPQHRDLEFKQSASGAFTATLPEGIWDSRATVLKLEMAAEQVDATPRKVDAMVSNKVSGAGAARLDWAAFLGRNDPVWTALPQKFDHGAFAGNGTLGVTIYQDNPNALRFAMGRNDVTSRARDNMRLLMGGLRLTTKGKITGGELRTDLWNAEIRGTVATDAGSIRLRAFVHAKRNVVVIDSAGSDGEAGCAWSWMPEMAVTGNAKYDGFENLVNPPSESGQTDGVAWCEQKRTAGGSYTAAWTEKGSRLFFMIADTFPQDASKSAAMETVKQASAENADDLHKSHRDWWHAYYPESFVSVPDAQVEGFYWIQMYKLASAMRPEGAVMDLQGPWNRATGWPRIWWNLNIQIAYTPVYTANRLELGESFTRFIDSRRNAFVANAKEIWGFDDCATTPHTTSYDGTNGDGFAAKDWGHYINPGDFTWALWLYWQQYRYSMDESLVKDQSEHAFYSLLKGSVNLYLHLLKPGEDGKLHLPKMHSPEYGEAPDNNYNLSLLRWGCETLLALNERYHLNDPQISEWKRVLKDLTPYPQDENGFMVGAGVPFARSHRHWSHMLMVWPLHALSCEQPENKEVVEKTLRHWLTVENAKQVYGWSAAAAAHLYATLGDGENALKQLRSHHGNKQFVMPNTQYIEGSPVYECSLVAASALQYMLLQSWGGTIRIFPAMPQEWSTASYQNLRAEGAFLVSAIRKDGRTSWVRIESLAGEPCKVRPGFHGTFACDRPDLLRDLGNGVFELALKNGESALLYLYNREQVVQPGDLGG